MKNLETTHIHEVINLLEKYLSENNSKTTPVVEYKKGTELEKLFNLNSESIETSEYLEEIKNYLKYSVRTTHPYCNNQLFAGINSEAVIAELLATITNTTMATYEMAPVATIMEQKLVQELNGILGFDNGDGIMLTGGSNANLMAIHLARHKYYPETKMKGNGSHEFCIFVSDQAHYSHQKAMMLMGIGLDNLISVKSNQAGQMDAQDLEAQINLVKDSGRTPLMVCSTAGTTVMGAFDPIDKVDAICKSENLWHHVDGAWGGAVMLSSKTKPLLQTIQNVDSFTFDAHKLLGTGIITSFFLTKHSNLLQGANSAGGSTYIFHDYENADFDTGPRSLQCGRKNDALKMWLTWKSRGAKGLEKVIDNHFENRDYFLKLIEEHPRLNLLFDPEYLNVCFQVLPKDKSIDINKYNFDLRFKVVQSGRVMTNFSSWSDGTVFLDRSLPIKIPQKKILKRF